MGLHGLFWWIGAGVLIVAELTSGTFYLLMIALGFIAGALAQMAGLPFDAQCALAAVVALVSVVALRHSRFGRRRSARRVDAAHDPGVNLDIGAVLAIDGWRDGHARATYRGAQWDAELAPGEPENAHLYEIVALRGNDLIVAAKTGAKGNDA